MTGISDLASLGICVRCTGRIFATIGRSLDNRTRGEMLFFALNAFYPDVPYKEVEEPDCPLCSGVISKMEKYFLIAREEIGDREYNSFLAGSVFSDETVRLEAEIQERFGSVGEPIKKEFNREFGKYFTSKTGVEPDFDTPDITIMMNLEFDYAEVEVRSIYLRGRYNKYRRDIPQTRWIYKPGNDESVESFIGRVMLEHSRGENFFLHAAGREDVDVRMLGRGRDFVMEITSPGIRVLDPQEIEEEINSQDNGVAVSGLHISDRDAVKKVKTSEYDKTYRVTVKAENRIDVERLKSALAGITGKVIYQRTPLRVAARRADLVRERTVRESVLEEVRVNTATILLRAEAGTYIKELVHGDEGRTKPCLSAEYGEPLSVEALDVMEINRSD